MGRQQDTTPSAGVWQRLSLQLEQAAQFLLEQLGPMRDGAEAHLSVQFGEHPNHE
jgi:hypothetical protein